MYYLCDLGQITKPLWVNLPICKLKMMAPSSSFFSPLQELVKLKEGKCETLYKL